MSDETPGAIVIVDHGSRAEAANALLDQAAAQLRERFVGRRVVAAHMEIAEPGLPEAIDTCVAAGARQITVALWFLAPGRHGKGDIPRMVEEARARHPGVRIGVAAPLGLHSGLIDAVVDRISESESHSRTG